MDDPHAHWKEIGRLTGWRLGGFNGMHQAAFYTMQGAEVFITPEVGAVIRLLAEALTETTEAFNLLIESVTDLPHLRVGYRRHEGLKETVEVAKACKRQLDALENDHGYLFSGFEVVKEDDG